MSLIGLANQTANPRVSVLARKRGTSILRPLSPEHPTDELIEGLLIVRPEGRVFFLNAQTIGTKINALTTQYKPDIFLLDMSRVPDIEYSALKMLIEGDKRLTAQGDTLWLAALNPTVLEVVRRTEWVKELEGRMFFNATTAIEHYLENKNLPSYDRREQNGSANL
jgi:MFS superfamily sulfate permease-like transporter